MRARHGNNWLSKMTWVMQSRTRLGVASHWVCVRWAPGVKHSAQRSVAAAKEKQRMTRLDTQREGCSEAATALEQRWLLSGGVSIGWQVVAIEEYRYQGKKKLLALGKCDLISLREARELRNECKRVLARQLRARCRPLASILIHAQAEARYKGSLSFRAIRAAGRSTLAIVHELSRGQALRSIFRRTWTIYMTQAIMKSATPHPPPAKNAARWSSLSMNHCFASSLS